MPTNPRPACCREGKLQDAMSCLEEVYNDCAAESKAKSQLDLMLDVGKWRNGMVRLCDNIDCESPATGPGSGGGVCGGWGGLGWKGVGGRVVRWRNGMVRLCDNIDCQSPAVQ